MTHPPHRSAPVSGPPLHFGPEVPAVADGFPELFLSECFPEVELLPFLSEDFPDVFFFDEDFPDLFFFDEGSPDDVVRFCGQRIVICVLT